MTALQYVSEYSQQFDKHLNADLILNIRKKDDMAYYIDLMWKELARHIPHNLKYLGYTYDDTRRRFGELNSVTGKKKKTSNRTMSITDTYARMAVFQFEATIENHETNEMETQYIETPIYIPLYIDNYHFYIRGNKYSAPFQIVDSIVYTSKNNIIVLKTMTRAIKMNRERRFTALKDVYDNKYMTYNFYIYMNSKKVPFLLYYLSYFGFSGTFTFFGADKFCKFYNEAPKKQAMDPDHLWFQFCTIYIQVEKKAFEEIFNLRQFISCLLEVQKRNMDVADICSTTRWKMILGASISEANALTKGEGLLKTFIISLDAQTVINIKKLIGGSPKENMHQVVRWMFVRFGELSSKTSSLLNKRIRISEWLIDPILKETYKKLYRFLTTNEKSRDMARLVDILRLSSGIILGAISGRNKQVLNLNIAKYSANVNDNVLISDALRFTSSGPGAPTSGGGGLSSQFRVFNSSYVGRIDLYNSSNSDPGTSGIIIPSTQINMETLTFARDILHGDT